MKTIITCPFCQFQKVENIPSDACVYRYECQGCKKIFTPKKEDCCVFCSYGSQKCASNQC